MATGKNQHKKMGFYKSMELLDKISKKIDLKFDFILSDGKKIKVRPFLVKEHKIILQAVELGSGDSLNQAVEDVLKNCTFNEIDIDKLPVFDVERLIMFMKAISLGEIITLSYRHGCKESKGKPAISLKVNLLDVPLKPDPKERKYQFMLSEDIGIRMKDLSYGDYKKFVANSNSNKGIVDNIFDVIYSSIDCVFDEQEIIKPDQIGYKRLQTFIENLPVKVFNEIEDFFLTVPKLTLELPITCPHCGSGDMIELKGLNDFLE